MRRAAGASFLLLMVWVFVWNTAGGQEAQPAPGQLGDLEQLARMVKAFPRRGKAPERFLITGILDGGAETDKDAELRRAVARGLGSNSVPEASKPMRNALLDARGDAVEVIDRLRRQGRGERIRIAWSGDLPPDLDGKAQSPADDASFREFLARRQVPADRLGLKSLAEARLELKDRSSPLFYHSTLFSLEHGLGRLREQTAALEAALPGAAVGGRLPASDGLQPLESVWLRPFQRRALTLAWAADPAGRDPTPQMAGYYLTALRAASQFHGVPMAWSLRPEAGGMTPDDLRRSFYSALGQGVKIFDFSGVSPATLPVGKQSMWQTIHDLVHEAGFIEHLAYAAKPRPPEVGLLLSRTQEVWSPDPALNLERKCLYLAMRHSGHTVDLVTDEEVQKGRLQGLKTVFVVGNHLEEATARALRNWVEEGGVLSGHAGGGFFNEYNQPMDILAEVYGVQEQSVTRGDLTASTRQDLSGLKPMDAIDWTRPSRKLPVLGLKQTIKPVEKAQVLARYAADGGPAATVHEFGKGRAVLVGTLLASGYVRSALPFFGKLPTDYDFDVADIVESGCGHGEVRFDYLHDQPLVEVNILESTEGLAAVLVNWSRTPRDLKLTLQGVPPPFNQASSLRHGALDMIRIGQTITLSIRVEVADVVLLEK